MSRSIWYDQHGGTRPKDQVSGPGFGQLVEGGARVGRDLARVRQQHVSGCEAFRVLIDSGLVGRGEVSRREKLALRGTDSESYITKYTLVYED